jgi:glycosyltransferase involved in cell wall biosynthesis
MLSILHLDTGRELRGGQWQILVLARALQRSGHRQLIACPQGSPLLERASRSGFDTAALSSGNPWDLRDALLLRRLIRRKGIEIVHAHDGRGQTVAWESSLGLPVRRVASRRVAFSPNQPLHYLKYSLTCNGVIAVSEFVKKLLVDSGVPAEKIAVIPDGIEWPAKLATDNDRRTLRAQWHLGEDDFVVGHVGAFTGEKGQDVAIEAARLLTKTLPRFTLLLAGNGPGRRVLEQQCATRGIPNVRFLGYCEDLYSFFTCLDLFIMPSRTEGLGSSVLLAMAHALPVVASRAGGLAEIVNEGVTGWLVEPGSPKQLAEAIVTTTTMRERLVTIGEAAQERARGFTSDIMAANTEAFYWQLLAGIRGAPSE